MHSASRVCPHAENSQYFRASRSFLVAAVAAAEAISRGVMASERRTTGPDRALRSSALNRLLVHVQIIVVSPGHVLEWPTHRPDFAFHRCIQSRTSASSTRNSACSTNGGLGNGFKCRRFRRCYAGSIGPKLVEVTGLGWARNDAPVNVLFNARV